MTTAGTPEKGKTLTPAEIEQVKNVTIFNQAEVDYTTLSPMPGTQACANCVFYRATGYDGIDWPHCHIVDGWPLPIEPTGWCKEWRLLPEAEILEPDPVAVYIVDAPDYADDDTAEMALQLPKSLKVKVIEFLNQFKAADKKHDEAFAVYKTANGKMAWVARHTGKWVDREGEIIAERALNAYVERVQKGVVDPPELWMWHNRATKHGQAVAVWKSGGFLLAAGYIDDTPAGRSAFKYYQKHSGNISLSHMFHYPVISKIDGVYYELNTVEITTLVKGAEAFPYTSFQEIQTMTLPDVAKDMIEQALGPDVLLAAIAADDKAAQDTKTLDSLGVASKNYDQYTGSQVLEAAQKLTQFEQVKTDLETRLKAAEDKAGKVESLETAVKTLSEAVKALNDKLDTTLKGEGDALGQIADLQKQIALMTDLKPPASQSDETLLNDREKTLVETMMRAAKSADTPSLVDTFVGGSPAISNGNGG